MTNQAMEAVAALLPTAERKRPRPSGDILIHTDGSLATCASNGSVSCRCKPPPDPEPPPP